MKISSKGFVIVLVVNFLLASTHLCPAQILQRTFEKANEKLEDLLPWERIEEDRHPEFPTFEALLRDSTLFRRVQDRARPYGNTFLLRSGLIATYDGPTIGLYSFEGKLIYTVPNVHSPYIIFIDSSGNFYCNHRKYLFPDYAKSIAFPYLNVQDTLGQYQYDCHVWGSVSDSIDRNCYHQKVEDFRRSWDLPCGDSLDCQSADFFGPHKGFLVSDRYGMQQTSHFSLSRDTLEVVDRKVRVYMYKNPLIRNTTAPAYIHYYALPNGLRCKTGQRPQVYRYGGKVFLLAGTGLYWVL